MKRKIRKKLFFLYQKFLQGTLSDKENIEFVAMKSHLSLNERELTEEYSKMAIDKLSILQLLKLNWALFRITLKF